VIVGSGLAVPVVLGAMTSSERQTPSPGTTFEAPLQFAAIQEPLRRTWVALEQARQLFAPGPKQLEQLESHDWHEVDVLSKYWDFEQVGRHRPFVNTGRSGLHVVHWLKEDPEQLPQSGWHLMHEPEDENELDGQVETHCPEEAKRPELHVRQKSGEPVHVAQFEEQAKGARGCELS